MFLTLCVTNPNYAPSPGREDNRGPMDPRKITMIIFCDGDTDRKVIIAN